MRRKMAAIFYKWYNALRFGTLKMGGVRIQKPLKITPEFISFGKTGIIIIRGARIEGVAQYNKTKYTPIITIGESVSIQQNLHLTCADSISIGDNTAIAANVTITDIHHDYTDINTPIERQDLIVRPVTIGRNCKIYNNSVILPGSNIGDHVTVAANSVVSSDIPSYTVVAGAPAKIVKRFNFDLGRWEKPL